MFVHLIFVVLALMTAPTSAYRTFNLYVTNPYPDQVYIILPWEMWGFTSQPSNYPGEWNNGWNVAAVLNVTGGVGQTIIPLYFALTSKSSHILRVSKTYAGAKANDNSIACDGLPITITQTTPNWLSITAGAHISLNVYDCGEMIVS